MKGTAVMQQSLVILTLRANQVQETGAKDATWEVVQEEAVTKDITGEADASTARNTHH